MSFLDGPPRGAGIGRIQAALGPTMERRAHAGFRLLRRHLPVLVTPWFAVVVRDADVRQVLGRRDDFSVARYTHKIMEVTGPFPLAFDDAAHYGPASRVLEVAIRRDDPKAVARRVDALARAAMREPARHGGLDVVAELVDPVLAQVVEAYLGVAGPDWQTLFDWARAVFTEIFISPTPVVRPPAARVVGAFRSHLDHVIARRKAEGPLEDGAAGKRDDVLARLLTAQVPDQEICGMLLGLIVAWIPSASKMTALVVDELLDRPDQLARAQDAARRGDDAALADILFETVRFRPPGPGIFRTANRPCRLGVGAARPKTVPAGTTVFAATASAMMDESALEAPEEFRVDRPWSDYLHFGYGLHTCAGEAIMRAVLPALTRPLLEPRGLRRAPGRAGRLRWRYPYPSRLDVTLDPTSR